MAHDVERFDRWAARYDRSYLQRLVFEPVHRAILDVAVAKRPGAEAILDVGCGTGRLLLATESVFPRARLEGVDAAAEMITQARAALSEGSDINVRQGVAEQLPFADASFELVFSSMTFHHWADQRAGIGEVARVLKPTGLWLLSDFVAIGLMRYMRRLLRLRRFPERAVLDPMLAGAALAVVEQHPVAGLRGQVPVLVIGKFT